MVLAGEDGGCSGSTDELLLGRSFCCKNDSALLLLGVVSSQDAKKYYMIKMKEVTI